MDMEFSEEQQQLARTARAFLKRECPRSLVRALETSQEGFSRELWSKIADLGWLGLPFPADRGGLGMGALEVAVLAKEMGRALLPSPYIPTVLLAGGAVAAAGSDEQKRAYLSSIAAGQTIVAFALPEAGGRFDPRSVALRATPSNGAFVLNGSKMFVEFAGAADRLLVVARTSGAKGSPEGVSMFLVDAGSPGIKLELLGTMARDRQYRVVFRDVGVSQDDVIGPLGGATEALEPVIQLATVALCAYMVGASEEVHGMATDFAKERVQFDRPIGSFQAIQHYLAQSITEIVAADTLTLYAAWTLDRGLPARVAVAKAKAFAGDAFKQASALGAQIFGGQGFNEDVDTTLFLRRGKQHQLSMGDSGFWEDVIAEELLDR